VLRLTVDLVSTMRCTTTTITHNLDRALRTGTRLLLMDRDRVVTDLDAERNNAMTVQSLIDLMEHPADRSLLRESA
jgi:ABC-type uncharacterized transport system ATPase component